MPSSLPSGFTLKSDDLPSGFEIKEEPPEIAGAENRVEETALPQGFEMQTPTEPIPRADEPAEEGFDLTKSLVGATTLGKAAKMAGSLYGKFKGVESPYEVAMRQEEGAGYVPALKRGVGQTIAGLGGGIALAGSIAGSERVKEIGKSIATSWEKYSEENPRPEYMEEGIRESLAKHPLTTAKIVSTEAIPAIVALFIPGGLAVKGATTVARAAGLGAKAVRKVAVASGTTGAMAGSGTLEGGSSYSEAIKAGATEEEARKAGVVVGVANGLLDIVPGLLFMKRALGKEVTGNFVKAAVSQALAEGSTETAQQFVSTLATRFYDEERDIWDKQAIDGYIESFLAGFLIGAPVGAISTTGKKPTGAIAEPPPTEAAIAAEKVTTEPISEVFAPVAEEVAPEIEPEAIKKPEIVTDPHDRQEIQNSIDEGRLMLETGKDVFGDPINEGRKLSIGRAIRNSQAKLGEEGVSLAEVQPKVEPAADVMKGEKAVTTESEAKKYRTKEDFIAGQKAVYHGTSEEFKEFDLTASREGGAWFTDRKESLTDKTITTTGEGVVMERFVKPDANLLNIDVPEDAKLIDNLTDEQLEAEGYDGTISAGDNKGESFVHLFNPNKTTATREQLSSIWVKGKPAIPEAKEGLPPKKPTAEIKAKPPIKLPAKPSVKPTQQEPVGFDIPDETRKDFFVRKAQDKFNRLLKIQTEIGKQKGKITEESDVYMAEEATSGKIGDRFDKLEDIHVKPLISGMRKTSVSLESLEEYLYAKHAPERNKQIRSIRDDMESGSGMSDVEAQTIIDKHAKAGTTRKLEVLAKKVHDMNDLNLKLMEEYGLVGSDTIQLWRDKYESYMPLKGLVGEEAELPKTGRGYDVRGEPKKALGRKSRAENILSQSIAQVQETIVKGEKAEVGRSLLKLVRENPDPDLWEVNKVVYRPQFMKDGRVVEATDTKPEQMLLGVDIHKETTAKGKVVYVKDRNYRNREEVFAVKEGGTEHLITLKDPLLAQQMKNLNVENTGAITGALLQVNRYLALVNIGLNPEFIITNPERDIQMGIVNIVGENEKGAKLAAKVVKDLPSAVPAIFKETFNIGKDSPMRKEYRELKEMGGTIGFFGLESVEVKAKQIQDQLEGLKKTPQAQAKRAMKAMVEVITDANISVENAMRLSLYKNAKEMGYSPKKAASMAKNVTVNFNRKGEWGTALNAGYLFYNASIQGSATIFKALKHRKTKILAGSLATTAMAVAAHNDLVGGEDEDGETYWSKIPAFYKESYFIWMKGDGSGDSYKIKLPYGYNVFWSAGYAMHDVSKKHITPAEGTKRTILTALNAFNPLGGSSDIVDMLTPTALKPFEQHARNINWTGKPIMPPQRPYQLPKPESERAWERTSPALKSATRKLNELTGGSEIRPGALSVSPEIVKHYTKWLTGGAGMFGYRGVTAIEKVKKGEDVAIRDVPIARTFVMQKSERADTERFYQNLEDVEKANAELELKYKEDVVARELRKPATGAKKYTMDNKSILMLRSHALKAEEKLKAYREQKKHAILSGNKEKEKELRKKINSTYQEFNREYNKKMKYGN